MYDAGAGPRSLMDRVSASEADDAGSIPAEGTKCPRVGREQEGVGERKFPVEEGWENRGFPRSEKAKRPAQRSKCPRVGREQEGVGTNTTH